MESFQHLGTNIDVHCSIRNIKYTKQALRAISCVTPTVCGMCIGLVTHDVPVLQVQMSCYK